MKHKSLPTVNSSVSRRGFIGALASITAAAAAAGCSVGEQEQISKQGFLLPPPSAKVQTTACAYCIVGCGYKAYSWPVGEEIGGPLAADNALGVDFPVAAMSGNWISPQMYNIVTREGRPHHLIVIPDAKAEVVNIGGDHNLGASLAQRFYSEHGETKDRLLVPQLRVDGELVAISWPEAIAIVGATAQHVLDSSGPLAFAIKSYSYQFYENTYAITKFIFEGIKSPCWAPHDQPAEGSSTPGLSDSGINAFSAAYSDWRESDVIFVSGVSLYEQRAILFSQWVSGGPKLVVVNPRRDETADYALENGGLFLQIKPGTDTLLHHAIARVIIEEGWQDSAFIASQVVNEADLDQEKEAGGRRARFAQTYEQYREFILGEDLHQLDQASARTGISPDQIRAAAHMMAGPRDDGSSPKTSMMLEKGNYWSHNYANSASLASLGVLIGAGNRPGQMISRGGGHQRGMLKGASYPMELSSHTLGGAKAHMNLDKELLSGNLRMAWVIGCTWLCGGSAHTNALTTQAQRQARSDTYPQIRSSTAFPMGKEAALNLDAVIESLQAKVNAGGLVMVQQDIYPQPLSELADLILPAASWGEAPHTRMQGERRLRHYAKLSDAPGKARSDWQIISDVAAYMGLEGFSWANENEIFEEGASRSVGKANDYSELVRKSQEQGIPAHEYLAAMGTNGIQCPVKREGNTLVGTTRLHENGFSTATGKTMFLASDYRELVISRDRELLPLAQELQIINRRNGSNWSSMVEDMRNSYRLAQFPDNLLEISENDARDRGIENGDLVFVSSDNLQHSPETLINPTQGGGFRAMAHISDLVRDGVACAYFNFCGNQESSANSVVPNTPDPVSGLYSFKLGRGRVEKLT